MYWHQKHSHDKKPQLFHQQWLLSEQQSIIKDFMPLSYVLPILLQCKSLRPLG